MDATTLVVGAGRGLGRGIAVAFAEADTSVVAVARTKSDLVDLAADAQVRTEVADATDPSTARRLLATYEPQVCILVAGAAPVSRPLQEHTWETFSVNWHVDVRMTFEWLREALLMPLRPGSRIIVVSSGAALAGSPLSGGYAGSKATQRFMTGYAQDEASRAGLDLTFTAVLPRLTPLTQLGRAAVVAYAKRYGQTEAEYVVAAGEPPLTPAGAGEALLELARTDSADLMSSYLLTGTGLRPLP
jgi:NAD(P)-dependent dehydrogenase (short-subunit alcohol dehydrogenase family)